LGVTHSLSPRCLRCYMLLQKKEGRLWQTSSPWHGLATSRLFPCRRVLPRHCRAPASLSCEPAVVPGRCREAHGGGARPASWWCGGRRGCLWQRHTPRPRPRPRPSCSAASTRCSWPHASPAKVRDGGGVAGAG
jgi:hypothetical protein